MVACSTFERLYPVHIDVPLQEAGRLCNPRSPPAYTTGFRREWFLLSRRTKDGQNFVLLSVNQHLG